MGGFRQVQNFSTGLSLQLLLLIFCLCYQQTVFIVSLCGSIFLFVLFITVFVLCVMGQKVLIVISGFASIDKCIFIVIIFNFQQCFFFFVVFVLFFFCFVFFGFFCEKQAKVCSVLLSLAEKLICQISASKLASSLVFYVYYGLIRALLSQTRVKEIEPQQDEMVSHLYKLTSE